MKIQCDVCNKEEASVFCSADEAALCEGCDRGVHHANKLASKHHRFSLLDPSSKEAPRCDICQERRAFLFCKEDRAILCRDCDVSIHSANDLTARHNRFLLTGVKLSSLLCSSSSDQTGITEEKQVKNKEKPKSVDSRITATPSPEIENNSCNSTISNTSDTVFYTSSISDYLIKTLPGWHVEDLLVDAVDYSEATDGFCKNDDLWKFMEADSDGDLDFVSDNQVPHISFLSGSVSKFGKDLKEVNHLKVHQRGVSDHGFTVPQLNNPSKRPRHI